MWWKKCSRNGKKKKNGVLHKNFCCQFGDFHLEVNKELKDLGMLAGQLTGLLAVEQTRNKK